VIGMVSEEMRYIIENRKALEKKHSGKYIAIHQREVVAIGKTIHEAYDTLENLRIENPLVTYIPREDEEALLI